MDTNTIDKIFDKLDKLTIQVTKIDTRLNGIPSRVRTLEIAVVLVLAIVFGKEALKLIKL